ncbi:MAG: EamA family transporter [Clostridiales bacterium]|nr:EamA family transporter [Clostridiales bacterium]
MNESYLYVGLYLLSILISVVSQLLLKISANKTYSSPIREYLNPYVIVAYGFFFLATILTMLALKYVPLSSAPVLESLSYILISILGYFVLKEKFNRKKLVGMAVILVGVFLFNL